MSVNPERQVVLDYLARFGLDGSEISAHDHTAEGFWLIRNEKTFHPWPKDLNYSWLVVALKVAAAADLRRAGIRV